MNKVETESRKVIKSVMAANDMTAADVDRMKIMARQTFYKKQSDPRLFTLDELWKLDKMLQFTDNEILALFGRASLR